MTALCPQVCERPLMFLLDTPGVLSPRIESMETGLKLALCGEWSCPVGPWRSPGSQSRVMGVSGGGASARSGRVSSRDSPVAETVPSPSAARFQGLCWTTWWERRAWPTTFSTPSTGSGSG